MDSGVSPWSLGEDRESSIGEELLAAEREAIRVRWMIWPTRFGDWQGRVEGIAVELEGESVARCPRRPFVSASACPGVRRVCLLQKVL